MELDISFDASQIKHALLFSSCQKNSSEMCSYVPSRHSGKRRQPVTGAVTYGGVTACWPEVSRMNSIIVSLRLCFVHICDWSKFTFHSCKLWITWPLAANQNWCCIQMQVKTGKSLLHAGKRRQRFLVWTFPETQKQAYRHADTWSAVQSEIKCGVLICLHNWHN